MSCVQPRSEFEALVHLADRVLWRFPELSEDAVFELIAAELETFDGVRLREYVPVLVEHNVMRTLRMLHRAA